MKIFNINGESLSVGELKKLINFKIANMLKNDKLKIEIVREV